MQIYPYPTPLTERCVPQNPVLQTYLIINLSSYQYISIGHSYNQSQLWPCPYTQPDPVPADGQAVPVCVWSISVCACVQMASKYKRVCVRADGQQVLRRLPQRQHRLRRHM